MDQARIIEDSQKIAVGIMDRLMEEKRRSIFGDDTEELVKPKSEGGKK